MIYVSVSDDLIGFPQIDKIAKGVAVVLESNAEIYPPFLGHYSRTIYSSQTISNPLK